MAAPSSMRAWQFTCAKAGIENTLKLNTVPVPQPKANEHLVQILYAATNPVDYKPAEIPLAGGFVVPASEKKPVTPGLDFAGRIVKPAAGSSLKPGQIVFGASSTNAMAGGALREYATTELVGTVAAPEGVSAKDLATSCVAAETAVQAIGKTVKPGDSIFINGGSGGTGVYAIQVAKAMGLKVTTTCSTANVDLCLSLGADKVIDYKKEDIVEALKSSGTQYSRVIDNVGSDFRLFFKAHEYTKPTAGYCFVAASPSLSSIGNTMKARMLPGSLGGGKRKFESSFTKPNNDELTQIGQWMKDGKVKAVIDSTFAFTDVPGAYRRQKSGRARGKIVVNVAGEDGEK